VAELLIELLSEEIPARMQARAAEDFTRLMRDALTYEGLSFDRAEAFVTPRRLTLIVDGLPHQQPDSQEERKGPKVGAPEKALAGFMKANGLETLENCEQRTVGKASFYFLVLDKKGRETTALLPELLEDVLNRFPWPKSMRWGRGKKSWVRPLRGIIFVFDGKALPFTADFGAGVTITAGAQTVGHRFMAPEPFTVASFADYAEKLAKAHVMLDPIQRRSIIADAANSLAQSQGLKVKDDPGLLDEVTGLVEWPHPLMGRIDDDFMDVPPEVLTTAMRSHQKYFSLEQTDGSLAPFFILVSNMKAEDDGKAIIAGNERVLRARLSDAKFFWDQDRKESLGSRLGALEKIIFHAKLGSVADKVERLQALAVTLADHIPACDRDLARSAALLCKADLPTGMVGEFPELQGLMGRYYALHQNEKPEVADAIAAHYKPQGPSDDCPQAPVSVAVALADKIDTLVGFFAIDEKPTGSKDPYALRRAALGVIRLLLENNLRLPLGPVLAAALTNYQADQEGGRLSLTAETDTLCQDLLAFFADRLKVALKDSGIRHDLISAVFAVRKEGGSLEDDLSRLLARVEALRVLVESEDGVNLLAAYRRATNILRIEEKKDGQRYEGVADQALLEQEEEKNLFTQLTEAQRHSQPALEREDFAEAMEALARLRGPVDAFFDEVTVNTEKSDLRANRLQLLSGIRRTLETVADFSKIEG